MDLMSVRLGMARLRFPVAQAQASGRRHAEEF
jgi:hypothetical protein